MIFTIRAYLFIIMLLKYDRENIFSQKGGADMFKEGVQTFNKEEGAKKRAYLSPKLAYLPFVRECVIFTSGDGDYDNGVEDAPEYAPWKD